MSTVIGIDPDAKASGVAVYRNGNLLDLRNCTTVDLVKIIKLNPPGGILVSIEDVMANQFVYRRNLHGIRAVQDKVALHIGRCQQVQIEIMQWLDALGVRYVLHKPQRGNWAKDKARFEKLTGWKGRSNEDTRSAAYFGFLEANKSNVRHDHAKTNLL